ncbi:MAG: FKBP-type peptidyl-prolyl cis-trans isomerase, partial [Myxococcota bacterium]
MNLSILWILLSGCGTTQPADVATDTPAAEGDAAAKAKAGQEDVPAPPDVAAAPSDAQATPSGLKYKVLTPGTGTDKPSNLSRVTARYTAWSPDGKMIETNTGRGRIANFGVQEAPIAFLREGLPLLTSGAKARFWVPAELGYDAKSNKAPGPITVDVELQTVVNPPPAPA